MLSMISSWQETDSHLDKCWSGFVFSYRNSSTVTWHEATVLEKLQLRGEHPVSLQQGGCQECIKPTVHCPGEMSHVHLLWTPSLSSRGFTAWSGTDNCLGNFGWKTEWNNRYRITGHSCMFVHTVVCSDPEEKKPTTLPSLYQSVTLGVNHFLCVCFHQPPRKCISDPPCSRMSPYITAIF